MSFEVKAEFDGSVFVPIDTVDLPPGTKVALSVTHAPENKTGHVNGRPPRPMTPEEQLEWEEISRQIAESEPEWPTVEEAMRYSRGRPW